MKPAKRKTIKKVIQAKIDDWLTSLPPEIAGEVKDKIIVSGGCIVSLLKGERINDYDFYLKDKKAALLLADHYVEEHGREDIKVCVETKPNIKGEDEERVIIVVKSDGVSGNNPDEVDESEEYIENDEVVDEEFDLESNKYKPTFLSRNAITLKNKVQIITRFFGEASQIHKNFDFIHCTCYYDSGDKSLVLPARALESILSESLYYSGSLYPIASIFRVKKYLSRGWRVQAGELLKIMWQISEIDMKNVDTLMDQLTGVDAAYMNGLIHALQKEKPEKLNSDYVIEVINRIFNSEGSF